MDYWLLKGLSNSLKTEFGMNEWMNEFIIIIIIIIIITSTEFSQGDSSRYTSTAKEIRINLYKRNNKKQ